MKIAAFDLGSNIAVAHNIYGQEHLKCASASFTGDRVARAGETLLWLEGFFETAKVAGGLDVVVYERPFARGQHATRSLWGVAGLIEGVCAKHGILIQDYAPSEIKKFTTGDGKADKDAMIMSANLTGYEGDNEHEADAWCLLRMAEQTLKPQRIKKGKLT